MGAFLSSLLDFLFPPRCIFCRKFLKRNEKHWCDRCLKDLPYTDGIRIYGDNFLYAVSPLFYRDNVRLAIHRYKFRGLAGYARGFGIIVADCVRKNVDDYDVVTWVPVSIRRQKTRGYDQSMLIAQAAALELGTVAIETLTKPVDNPSQSGIEAAQRRKNVEGVFSVRDPELVVGKRVLLIDDIITTGATLSECSSVLLGAGALSVICVTLSHAAFDRKNN